MVFDVQKSCHLCISFKEKPLKYAFSINRKALTKENSCNYLGMTVAEDLELVQVNTAKSLGLIYWILGVCSIEVKMAVFTALVRPSLEYAISAWNLYSQINLAVIENVQQQSIYHGRHTPRGMSPHYPMVPPLVITPHESPCKLPSHT